MDDQEDERMGEGDVVEEQQSETLLLSDDERRVLELYDKLQQLQLEVAIINAQSSIDITTVDDSSEGTKQAQDSLLEARARYRLRNDASELVMTVNPILKAVHSGTSASPIERDLLPYVEKRDDFAISAANGASDAWKLRRELTEVQSKTIQVCRQNIELTAELFTLVEELKAKKAVDLNSAEVAEEVQTLEASLRSKKQRWRVIKGVAGGVVAGSGVDWIADEKLREIVLDPENEY